MALLIALIVALTISLLLVEAGILLLIEKLFKIEKPTYKNALKILILYAVASVVLGFVFSLFNIGFLSDVLVTVVSFFVFYYLLKKYITVSWKKSLAMYLLFGLVSIVVVVGVVVPTRLFILEPFSVNGEAMSPTYNNGDYLLVNKISKKYNRGDVVVFTQESSTKPLFIIERIVGLPLEKVEIKNGDVYIDGRLISDYSANETDGNISVTLGKNEYFVLGDNRPKSQDSRYFGPISRSSIEGKVFYKVSGITK